MCDINRFGSSDHYKPLHLTDVKTEATVQGHVSSLTLRTVLLESFNGIASVLMRDRAVRFIF